MTKTAFITGITGQDGSFLAELLLSKGYKVVGLISAKYNIGYQNINHIKDKIILEPGDLINKNSLLKIIKKYNFSEIYNLGGITFIPKSWEQPELTFQINTIGCLNILDIIKDFSRKTKFYQATSAKIFGDPSSGPQTEESPIRPGSPYAVSKVSAHFLVQNYRKQFKLFACSGIMYNHESERRGEEFVTRKITLNAAKIKLGLVKKINLGNLESRQDWGYAPDYMEGAWLMMQQYKGDDFILASGKPHKVKDICQIAFDFLNLNWQKYIEHNTDFVRIEATENFYGDFSKAKKILGWQPKTNFKKMVEKMVANDLKLLKEKKI